MVDKSNRFLFVADSNNGTLGSGDIYSFTINSDGTLTSVRTPAYTAGNPVYGIAEDESGNYLVAAVLTSNATWAAVVLTVNYGILTYSNEQTGISGGIPFYWAVDPSMTHGDLLYSGAWSGTYFYSAALSGGSITVTTTTKTSGNLYYPAWIE